MEQLKDFFLGFYHAGVGILESVKAERNLRVHLFALLTVGIAGGVMELSLTHWCIVILCCMVVISLELVNTALERLGDRVSTEIHPLIRQAKDAAAGAVLVSALGSIVIAGLLLYGGENARGAYYLRFAELWQHDWMKILLPCYILLGAVFVFLPSHLQKKHRNV